MNNASLYIFPGSPIFFPSQRLHRSDFTDESAWSRSGSTMFGFECRMRGEKTVIWTQPSPVHSHPLPASLLLAVLAWGPRAMKGSPWKTSLHVTFVRMFCSAVASWDWQMWEQRRPRWDPKSTLLNVRMKAPLHSQDWRVSARSHSPWFQVWLLLHSHQTVCWFEQKLKARGTQLSVGSCFPPEAADPGMSPAFTLQLWATSKFLRDRTSPRVEANEPIPASCCHRSQKPAHSWEPRKHS